MGEMGMGRVQYILGHIQNRTHCAAFDQPLHAAGVGQTVDERRFRLQIRADKDQPAAFHRLPAPQAHHRQRPDMAGDGAALARAVKAPTMIGASDQPILDNPARQRRHPVRAAVRQRPDVSAIAKQHQRLGVQNHPQRTTAQPLRPRHRNPAHSAYFRITGTASRSSNPANTAVAVRARRGRCRT